MKTDQQICRVCLDSNNNFEMHYIFDIDEEEIEISQKLSDCAGINIEKNDNLPNHICNKCYDNLIISFRFRKLCQITEQKLKIKNEEKNVGNFYLDSTIKLEVSPHLDYPEELSNQNIEKRDFIFEIEELENLNDEVVQKSECIKRKTKKKSTKISSLDDLEKNEKIPQLLRKKLKAQKEKLFICEICGNFYNKKYQLRRHREIHTDIMNFECEICHKKFRQNNYLARHMRCHTGQKPHECKYCGRCFSDLSTKIKHERLHTGERPFKCETCGKSFTYSDVLKKHMLVHTGEKPFSCDICGSSFSRKHHLTTHFKSLMHLSKLK